MNLGRYEYKGVERGLLEVPSLSSGKFRVLRDLGWPDPSGNKE